ncbi:MAG: FAD-dependent oxidoreductase, partial [Candidatus Fimenecus sp.]|nr:FAD-dependent oxidoreductase [Candidatus Fimenecus sp.]
MMYDIIVIGAGPAGLTAALYSVRAGKSVLVLEKANYGGQMALSPRIENYLGFSEISGYDLSEMIFKQVETAGAELLDEEALSISEKDNIKTVKTDGGEYRSKAVIIATGMRHKVLGVENENEYSGNGISYCAACDGAFYKDKCVAVVGGGNSAVQEALYLCDICKSITVIQNLPSLTAENKLCEQLKKRGNVRFLFNTVITEFTGDGEKLTGVIAEN